MGSVLIDDKQNTTHTQHNDTNQYEDEQAINDIDIKLMHERFPDETDEEVSAYIDLIILAIVTNAQRQEAYVQNPSVESLQEIHKHSTYITAAEGCTNVHVQRIIRNFKSLVKYADNFDPNNTHLIKHDENVDNKRTAEIETKEIDITRDKLQHNSIAEIELKKLNNEMYDEIAHQRRAEIETNEIEFVADDTAKTWAVRHLGKNVKSLKEFFHKSVFTPEVLQELDKKMSAIFLLPEAVNDDEFSALDDDLEELGIGTSDEDSE